MDLKAANIILEYGGEIDVDYSGRGMYGETTAGVIFDSDQDFFAALGAVMINEDESEREIVGTAIKNLRIDNMGKGLIYY